MNTSNKTDKNDDAAEEVAKTPVEKDNDEKDNKPTEPKEEQEKKDDDNKGDECCICLEELPKDTTKFVRMTCCGNGLHIHCNEDLNSMEVGRNCPLCRSKTPSSDEEEIKQLHPWVKKKKAWALTLMGQMYKDGEGVKQSYEMARRLYEQAAQQGDVSAMAHLGFMYCQGQGVEQSYEKAFEYYEQAAQLGHAEAQYNLGFMYATGKGVTKDELKAKEWWTASAEQQGDEKAIKNLKILEK